MREKWRCGDETVEPEYVGAGHWDCPRCGYTFGDFGDGPDTDHETLDPPKPKSDLHIAGLIADERERVIAAEVDAMDYCQAMDKGKLCGVCEPLDLVLVRETESRERRQVFLCRDHFNELFALVAPWPTIEIDGKQWGLA